MSINSARLSSGDRGDLDRRDRLVGERGNLRFQRSERAGLDDHLLHVGDVVVVEVG